MPTSPESEQATFLCPGGLTAWPVLQPLPARGRGPAPPPQAPGGAPAPGPQRGGGGPFAIRAVYVLSGDGDLHAVNINTGDDLAPPMKFLPPNGKPYSLALVNNVIYTITGQGCGGNPNSVYSLDLNDPARTVRSWRSGSGGLWGTAGAGDRIGRNGVRRNRRRAVRPGDEALRERDRRAARRGISTLKDWYVPSNAEWLFKRDLDMNVTPVVFPYKGRDLIVGSGKEGRFFMLDSASLGGADHRTPLYRSDLISNEDVDFAGAGTWGSLATWEDALGTRWVLAPVWGPKHPERQVSRLERRDQRRDDRGVQGRGTQRQAGADQRVDGAQHGDAGGPGRGERRRVCALDGRVGAAGERQGRRLVSG